VHLPTELRWIDAVAARYPELAQVACFDTAFHRGLPEVARRFALPSSLYEAGVRRYGFHGLSYEYVVDKLGPAIGGRSIIAHLGNGASMVALLDRKPIDTTMGLTPAGGFMMGTRTGDMDPGVLLYLLRSGKTAHDLEKLVDHESGLLGVSGSTSDMKELLQRRAGDDRADLAFEMFCYQARKTVGALVAALGGLDTLVFTGGIGERAAPVRERICAGLECLGVRIDRTRNEEAKDVISPADSPCIVRVCATDEELTIAKHTYRLLFSAAHPFPE
jgi:acetate kinase